MGRRTGKKLKILVLTDLSNPIPREEYARYLETEDWKTENDVLKTLGKLGHEPRLFGLAGDIRPLFEDIANDRPDMVFNLCEAFGNDRDFEPHIASFLELMRVRYTGAGVTSLRICKDKGLTKKILAFHKIQVPRFVTARRNKPAPSLKNFKFPAFIKPLMLEGSEGISQVSFAANEKDTLERIKFVHERLGVDAIVEEYIEGRELYVSVLGNGKLTVFPPRELFFKQVPEGEPKFATFRAKWDDAYRKKWGIDTGPAAPISPDVQFRIVDTCKKIYHTLQIRGYGRIDLRLTADNEVYFIEANPNPSIGREDDFALSAEKGGMSYKRLLAKIINLGLG